MAYIATVNVPGYLPDDMGDADGTTEADWAVDPIGFARHHVRCLLLWDRGLRPAPQLADSYIQWCASTRVA